MRCSKKKKKGHETYNVKQVVIVLQSYRTKNKSWVHTHSTRLRLLSSTGASLATCSTTPWGIVIASALRVRFQNGRRLQKRSHLSDAFTRHDIRGTCNPTSHLALRIFFKWTNCIQYIEQRGPNLDHGKEQVICCTVPRSNIHRNLLYPIIE